MNSNQDWDKIKDVKITRYITSFKDDRGKYNEIFNLKTDHEYHFKQLSVVHNNENTIRGMHGDWGTKKKISVISGKVIQVLLDCRIKSKTYGKYKSSILTAEDEILITIPPGVANGFQVIEGSASYLYLQDTFYGDFKQFTVTPYDASLKDAFNLSIENIISLRDLDKTKTLDNLNHMHR